MKNYISICLFLSICPIFVYSQNIKGIFVRDTRKILIQRGEISNNDSYITEMADSSITILKITNYYDGSKKDNSFSLTTTTTQDGISIVSVCKQIPCGDYGNDMKEVFPLFLMIYLPKKNGKLKLISVIDNYIEKRKYIEYTQSFDYSCLNDLRNDLLRENYISKNDTIYVGLPECLKDKYSNDLYINFDEPDCSNCLYFFFNSHIQKDNYIAIINEGVITKDFNMKNIVVHRQRIMIYKVSRRKEIKFICQLFNEL